MSNTFKDLVASVEDELMLVLLEEVGVAIVVVMDVEVTMTGGEMASKKFIGHKNKKTKQIAKKLGKT